MTRKDLIAVAIAALRTDSDADEAVIIAAIDADYDLDDGEIDQIVNSASDELRLEAE